MKGKTINTKLDFLNGDTFSSEKSELNLLIVLVVDDNADMRDYISSVLSTNYNVITANNGMDALHKIKENTPALVLSNITMPVMDGIGLLKEIKSNKATANIPVILLTTQAEEESSVEDWQAGADDYIVKPFSAKELVSRVKVQIKMVKLRTELEGNAQRLFIEAPVLICMFRGPKHVYELANKMYLQFIENRDVLGKPVRTAFPELEGTGIYELLDGVYSTGEPFFANEMLVKLDKGNENLDENYFNFVYQPSLDADGKIDGVMMHGIDVTEQILARKKIEESEIRFRSLVENSITPFCIFMGEDMILEMSNQLVLDIWQVSKEAFGKPFLEILPEMKEQSFMTYMLDVYHNGVTHKLDEMPTPFLRKNGEIETRYYNFVFQPYYQNENTVVGIMVNAIDLTDYVVARKKIEDSEKQQAFLLKLSDAIKELIDPADIQLTACRILGEHVKATRVLYVEVLNEELLVVNNNYINGVAPIIATFNAEVFGKHTIDAFKNNEKVIINDIHTNDRYSEDVKSVFMSLGIVANAGTGLVKGGRWVAALGMHFNAPREWTATEILLMEETAERTWAAVERAKAEEALRKSEEKYRLLFDSIDEAVSTLELIFDENDKAVDFTILDSNPAMSKVTGLPINEVQGKTAKEILPNLDQFWLETYEQVVKTGKPIRFENKQEDLNNNWFEVYAAKVGDKQSKKLIIVYNNITERKEAEEKIKESEERFRMIANVTPNMVWAINPDGSTRYVNTYTLDYFGRTTENFPSDWSEFIHPDDLEFVMTTIQQAFAKSTGYQLGFRLKRHDGTYPHFMANSAPAKMPDGTLYGYIGTTVDITEMREAQLSLLESESRFRILAEKLPQMVWVMSADGTMEYGSDNWKEYSGIDGITEAWSYMMHPEDSERLTAYWNQMFAGKKGYHHEVRLKNKGGIYRWFYSVGEPVMGVDGKVNKWVGSLTDIHEQKSFTEKLEATVAERTKELQRSNEDLQQFAHVASHDLKEPVRKVKTFANRLEKHGKLDETGSRFLDRIQSASDRMYSMIDGVLSYSTIDAYQQSFQKVDLNAVIQSIETDLEVAFQKTGARIIYNKLPAIEGTEVLLYQLFYNLINNSIKFAQAGRAPQINIVSKNVVRESEKFVELTLSDNGIGFEEEHAKIIFNTFIRLHSKDKYEGTGLGLALCKKIVERHGGTITAKGTPDGASFTITIPLKQKDKKL